MANGYIASTKDVFVMGRAVHSGWSREMLIDPSRVSKDPDCWFIQIFAGDLQKAFDQAPFYYLPFLCFGRRNKLKILTTVSLTNKILAHDSL